MLPLYIATLIAAWVMPAGLIAGSGRFALLCTCLGLVFCGAIASIVSTVVTAAPPTGSYEVAAEHMTITHASRNRAGQQIERQIAADIWYPAAPQPADDAKPRGTEAGFLLSRRNPLRPRSGNDAPTARAAYPLLLYFPSWSGNRFENTFLLKSLASHGYVVAAIDYPEGEVLRPDVADIQPFDLTAPMNFSSQADNDHTLQRAELRVRSQAKDAAFVLDRLRLIVESDKPSGFSERVNFDAIGVIGFSFGGAVAFQAAWLDHRIKAAVNMDGWMFGDAAIQGFTAPRLVMSDDTHLPSISDTVSTDPQTRYGARLNLGDDCRSREQLAKFGGYRVQILGTRHINFSDRPLYSIVPRLVGAGTLNPRRGMSIIDAFAVAFFDKYLKGRPAPLLDDPQPKVPEAIVVSWPGKDAPPVARSIE